MSRDVFDRSALYVGIVAYIVATYLTLSFGSGVARLIVPEDHYAETVGALSFLAASVLFLLAFRALRRAGVGAREGTARFKALVVLGLGILFLFAFGEEISWGQRIFGVEEPAALERINAQDELNVHNIEIGQWVVPYERLFDLLWLALAVAVPLAAAVSVHARRVLERYVPVVHWGIGLLFVVNYLLAKVAKAVFESSYSLADVPFAQAVQEIKESNYALLFALVAACSFAYARPPGHFRDPASQPVELPEPARHAEL